MLPMIVLRDTVPTQHLIMGCKAVFRTWSTHVLRFAGRGDPIGP